MNSQHLPSHPIGIFDSGIGGLTVAHALVKHLPREPIVYFGDTAHMPYGDKSPAAIQAYAVKIAQLLLERECKLILIACNSASTAAYQLVKEYVGTQAVVMNVIDPVIEFIQSRYHAKKIGLIGTRQTVQSQVYQKKIEALNLNIHLSAQATNLLASAIEEFGDHDVVDALLDVYLSKSELQNIDALVLACTHYPVVKKRIASRYPASVDIIDSSDIVAFAVKETLARLQLLHDEQTSHVIKRDFFVSDYTESFAQHAKIFFGDEVNLSHYPLWE